MDSITILAATDGFEYSYTTSSTASSADATAIAGIMLALAPLILLLVAVALASVWKVFSKAGRPGWAALVPFYNLWVYAEIVGKPGWWGLGAVLINFIPLIGPVASTVIILILSIEMAKRFGKSPTFGVVGLWLFSIVGYLILAFGSAKYQSVTGSEPGMPAAAQSPEKPSESAAEQKATPPQDPPTNLIQ